MNKSKWYELTKGKNKDQISKSLLDYWNKEKVWDKIKEKEEKDLIKTAAQVFDFDYAKVSKEI